MRGHLVEGGIALGMLLVAVWIGQGYPIEGVGNNPQGMSQSSSQRMPEQGSHVAPPQNGSLRPVQKISARLQARNIFTEDGRYTTLRPGVKDTTPLNGTGKGNLRGQTRKAQGPFLLVAILQGEGRMAIFKDPSGSLHTQKKGDQLGDGFIIMDINHLTVTVRKGKMTEVRRIFGVEENSEGRQIKEKED